MLGYNALLSRRAFGGNSLFSLRGRVSRRVCHATPRFHSRSYNTRHFADPDPNTANVVVGGTIAACVSVFAYTAYAKDVFNSTRNSSHLQFISNNLVCSARNVREGRYWTCLTYTLSHANMTHLLFNMVGLWTFGRTIVMIYGTPTFVALWVGAGVTGAISSLVLQKERRGVDQQFIGASGSVMGLSAAYACAFPFAKMLIFPFPFPIWNWVASAGFAAYSIYAQTNGLQGNIGHLGHLGGMGFGALYWLLRLRRPF